MENMNIGQIEQKQETSVRVSNRYFKILNILKDDFQTQKGRFISNKEVIERLVDFYIEHKNKH
jgi:hypothetical protein